MIREIMGKTSFEKQMTRMQEIVEILEKGEVILDESIKLYEEGLNLSKELKKQLNEYEKTIEKINEENEE